jgi:5-formyltetrahydrofolate cyclo-ligase
VPASRIDVFAVPGLLFARDGIRLGRGWGYYDRLLSRARPDALRIGICYSDRVRDALPSAAHDVPVRLLVTDAAVLHCPAPPDAEDA